MGADGKVCEGPDCDAELPPHQRGGTRRFCSRRCQGRASRARAADLTEKRCGRCKTVKPISEFYAAYNSYCKDCMLASQRAAYREGRASLNRDTVYAKSLKRLYGITLAQYEAMAEEQRGRCAICGDEPEKRLRVDHDHATGAIRELLCNPCNVALAQARDNPDLLRAMIAYLERHGAASALSLRSRSRAGGQGADVSARPVSQT